jgi:hypothetical protein
MTPERLSEIIDIRSRGLAPLMTEDEGKEVSFIRYRFGFNETTVCVKRHNK